MTTRLGVSIQALARAHRSRLAALLSAHGIHPGQDQLLMAVWTEPGLRQAVLAARLSIEAATVTRMVQRLEKSGLIERRSDRHDARAMCVHPTARSRLLETAVRRAWDQLDDAMQTALGSESDRLQQLLSDASAALASSDCRD